MKLPLFVRTDISKVNQSATVLLEKGSYKVLIDNIDSEFSLVGDVDYKKDSIMSGDIITLPSPTKLHAIVTKKGTEKDISLYLEMLP